MKKKGLGPRWGHCVPFDLKSIWYFFLCLSCPFGLTLSNRSRCYSSNVCAQWKLCSCSALLGPNILKASDASDRKPQFFQTFCKFSAYFFRRTCKLSRLHYNFMNIYKFHRYFYDFYEFLCLYSYEFLWFAHFFHIFFVRLKNSHRKLLRF